MSAETCGICGNAARIDDGIVGMLLCDDAACLDAAWEIAFHPVQAETTGHPLLDNWRLT